MMLSYIWTIRLCQPCHMLHMAIMAIMAQSHGNQAIMAHLTTSCRMRHMAVPIVWCCEALNRGAGRRHLVILFRTKSLSERPKNLPKDEHFIILKKEHIFCCWNHSKLRHSHWHWMLHHWNYLIKPWLTHKIEEIVYIHKKKSYQYIISKEENRDI